MTRDEARAKCIEAMAIADSKLHGEEWDELKEADREDYRLGVRPLFDSLHGVAGMTESEIQLRDALHRVVDAKALSGVRALVAGWNGEGRSAGPHTKHPARLGATLPKTTCGAIYELDEALQAAWRILDEAEPPETKP